MLCRTVALAALDGTHGAGSLLLRRVSVPRACLADQNLRSAADAEGVVACDVTLASNGDIASVNLASAEVDGGMRVLDAKGAMLWPAFVVPKP